MNLGRIKMGKILKMTKEGIAKGEMCVEGNVECQQREKLYEF
jgi:hypothetical protein